MSYNLWKSFLEDDVETFRLYMAGAGPHGPTRTASASVHIASSPGLGTSPKTPKTKKGNSAGNTNRGASVHWTKAEINARDRQGLTLLHRAASSHNTNAIEFVKVLLENPQLDLYVQDSENGWTALHRALYFGNIDVAQALMLRDIQNASSFAATAFHSQAGGLVKIKDNEGNSPFEVFLSTIAPRILHNDASGMTDAADDDSTNGIDIQDDAVDKNRASRVLGPRVDLQGDEVYAFGSNKNLTLGLGDEDDRQFPERIYLQRPEHLVRRLYQDYLAALSEENESTIINFGLGKRSATDAAPAIVQHKAIEIQEIVMSKLHTAILTGDPISNLYVTGFGVGGRLGTGDETTRFDYVCIQGALAKRRVSTIALGQDHSLAICSSGEVFTWGNAQDGKLGYALPETLSKEVPVQLVPRQLYGLVKKEQIVGAAASAIHSIIFTPTALFAFGRNAGQLGLVDADARSLQVQVIPRRVGTSIIQSPILSVSAIDRATTVLLENHDVFVFTHYAYKKILFPFEEAPDLYSNSALRTTYDKEPNSIVKISTGGNTICAVSSYGQVFTIDVPKVAEHVPANVSTTNPNKARNTLPQPWRVWSIGKSHMSAIDAAVGQDGSIILCTSSGAVWRKEKRAIIKSVHENPKQGGHVKDYKFSRVPNITRAVAVRSNARGAFAIVRKDCEVTREQVIEDPPSLWHDLFPLLSFHDYGAKSADIENEDSEEPPLRFWVPKQTHPCPSLIKSAVLTGKNVEDDFILLSHRFAPLSESGYDTWITSNVTDVRIPAHAFVLKARSAVLRKALASFEQSYYHSISDVASIEYGQDGHIQIQFQGADFLTIINLLLYIYSEDVIDVWHHTAKALQMAPRYRQVRIEVMKIAASLELGGLEQAARVMNNPARILLQDMETALTDTDFFAGADVAIDLANDAEMPAHSALLAIRCPFFEGLFHGHAGGMWVASRLRDSDEAAVATRVDLKHVDARVFELVLRHIYADTGEELFDSVVSSTLDDFLDLVIDVASIANELMLDRLSQICQKVVGKYVNTRNVCSLLNTLAECSVTNFKTAAFEYICLNLEGLLAQHLLEELDEYLLDELAEVVQANQLAYMPIVRSGRTEQLLLERHPELLEDLDRARRSRIDSMKLQTRFVDDERWTPRSRQHLSPDTKRVSRSGDSQVRKSQKTGTEDDFPFSMDDDASGKSPLSLGQNPPLLPVAQGRDILSPNDNVVDDDHFVAHSIGTDASQLTPLQMPLGWPSAEAGSLAFELPKAAWTATTPQSAKSDFKMIMEQTSMSSPRISNLSRALSAAATTPSKNVTKISQSQRKKQAQELKQQESSSKEPEPSSSTSTSPWAKVKSAAKPVTMVPTTMAGPSTVGPQVITQPLPSVHQNATTKPSSANPTEIPKGKSSSAVRTVSNPVVVEKAKPASPAIQSIRHTPVTNRSRTFIGVNMTMAEIQAYEQAEKLAIKEVAAKRPLQDIQQEQEFEVWWHAESRRVQDEEARTSAAAMSDQQDPSRKSSRGRGRRGRGAARGTTAISVTAQKEGQEDRITNQVADTPGSHARTLRGGHTNSDTRGGGGGDRGRGRGRGRNKILTT